MSAEIVTIIVAATLIALVVTMVRQRDATVHSRHRQHDSTADLWKSPQVRVTPISAEPPPRDPDAAGREVMAHLHQLSQRTPGLAAQVIPVFLKDTAIRLEALKVAVGQHDVATAHRVAHTLHGSAATVGSASMVRACTEIIREVRLGAFDGCAEQIANLDRDFDSIRRAAAAMPPEDVR